MKKHIKTVVGLILGIGVLWLLFRDTDWAAVAQATRSARWGWLLVSLVLVLATFVTRVQRWSYIVRTAKPVSFRHLFSATQIGFLGNFVLPARIGEVLRALVLSRLVDLPFARCFAFVALDRVTDLFGLIVVIGIALAAFRPESDIALPPGLLPENVTWDYIPANMFQTGALTTGAVIALVLMAFVILYFKQDLLVRLVHAVVAPVSGKLAVKLEALLRSFAEGLHVFRSAGDMSKAIAFSMLTWFLGVLCYHAILVAFGLATHWYTAILVMAFLAVAISIPGAPGFVGMFHVAVALAVFISDPGVDYNAVLAAAIMAHLMNLVPVVVVGGICLYTENLGLLALRREGEALGEEQA